MLSAERDFIETVITRGVPAQHNDFHLSPAYAIYMMCRYRISPHYRTSLYRHERAEQLVNLLTQITQECGNVITV